MTVELWWRLMLMLIGEFAQFVLILSTIIQVEMSLFYVIFLLNFMTKFDIPKAADITLRRKYSSQNELILLDIYIEFRDEI